MNGSQLTTLALPPSHTTSPSGCLRVQLTLQVGHLALESSLRNSRITAGQLHPLLCIVAWCRQAGLTGRGWSKLCHAMCAPWIGKCHERVSRHGLGVADVPRQQGVFRPQGRPGDQAGQPAIHTYLVGVCTGPLPHKRVSGWHAEKPFKRDCNPCRVVPMCRTAVRRGGSLQEAGERPAIPSVLAEGDTGDSFLFAGLRVFKHVSWPAVAGCFVRHSTALFGFMNNAMLGLIEAIPNGTFSPEGASSILR